MPRKFMIDGHGPYTQAEAYDRLIERVSFAQSRSCTTVREILDQALIPELMGFVVADANKPDAKLAIVLESESEDAPVEDAPAEEQSAPVKKRKTRGPGKPKAVKPVEPIVPTAPVENGDNGESNDPNEESQDPPKSDE